MTKNRTRVLEEDDGPIRIRIKRGDNLDDWVLKILDQEEPVRLDADADRKQGTVVWIGKKTCRVRIPGAEILCDVSGEIQREQQTALAVGDEAVVHQSDAVNVVRQVLPRKTKLSRPDPQNPNIERVVVANVDVVVITVSVKTPPLHPRLIDRYLVAIQHGGAAPVICVNKLDLLQDPKEREEELSKLDPYIAAGVEITTCSSLTHEGMLKLRQVVEGKTCAFVGHSGVGKSSILNAIKPDLNIDTGSVSEGYGRGTHTTTASSLYHLPGGTRLIDTPGIRSFGLWKMSPAELCLYFPEFQEHSVRCKFGDCTHTHEPTCGVKCAVETGNLSRNRYETYLRLLAS
jgi:ribosome biogenesis GTPase